MFNFIYRMVHEIKMDITIRRHNLTIINNRINLRICHNRQFHRIMDQPFMLTTIIHIHMAVWQGNFNLRIKISIFLLNFGMFFFCYSANGNGHYSSQQMQQPQSPYMGVGYNKGQYNAGPHMQRAPIYDGKFLRFCYSMTFFSKKKKILLQEICNHHNTNHWTWLEVANNEALRLNCTENLK